MLVSSGKLNTPAITRGETRYWIGFIAITVSASMFADATYEGDLFAVAKVPYRVGREGRDEYGESLAPEQPDAQLQAYNFRLTATKGTAAYLQQNGLEVEVIFKVNENRPSVADQIVNGKIDLVINTPLGRDSFFDDRAVRRAAMMHEVPCITTLTGAAAAGSEPMAWRLLGEYLGEAYQVADDIRDVISDPALLGKPVGQDLLLGGECGRNGEQRREHGQCEAPEPGVWPGLTLCRPPPSSSSSRRKSGRSWPRTASSATDPRSRNPACVST